MNTRICGNDKKKKWIDDFFKKRQVVINSSDFFIGDNQRISEDVLLVLPDEGERSVESYLSYPDMIGIRLPVSEQMPPAGLRLRTGVPWVAIILLSDYFISFTDWTTKSTISLPLRP